MALATTIKMLCGLLPPTSGHASVAGHDIDREREQIKRETGYMAQTFSLYPDLTVEENFRFFGGAYGVYGQAATRRMETLFRQVELDDLRRMQAGRLSGGMKQRLALACALVHEPQLVFLDEPTAGVDPARGAQDFLRALQGRDVAASPRTTSTRRSAATRSASCSRAGHRYGEPGSCASSSAIGWSASRCAAQSTRRARCGWCRASRT
jgi:ABC-type polar amino acid transport system ATPase subunit